MIFNPLHLLKVYAAQPDETLPFAFRSSLHLQKVPILAKKVNDHENSKSPYVTFI